jgi:predicted transcriptional regulator of viral defense system/very-short-patch-repair endonuclease
MGVTDARLEALAASQYGVFALWQLEGIGIDARTVTARAGDGRLRRLFRGVYSTGPYLSVRGQWMAAALACGPGAALSHRAAGALWELIEWRGGPIDVTAPGRLRSRRGLRVHWSRGGLQARDRAVVDGITVTSVARTLLDLAAALPPTQLQRAYEQAERAQALDVSAIRALLERCNGHRGVGRLRRLLDYDPALAARAESELERLFLDLVRGSDLPSPQVNVLVEGYLVDAYWPGCRLVVALNGYEFHSDRASFRRDHEKLGRLKLAGYEVLPLTYWQVTEEGPWVIDAIRTILAGTTRIPTL